MGERIPARARVSALARLCMIYNYIHIFIYLYVYIYMYMYICMYICIYNNTYLAGGAAGGPDGRRGEERLLFGAPEALRARAFSCPFGQAARC